MGSNRFFEAKSVHKFERPPELIKKIDESFERVSNADIKSGYLLTGADEHGFVLYNLSSTSNEIIKELIKAKKQQASLPLIQCDVGAGDFSYNKANDATYKAEDVITYGITAKDFRSESQRKNAIPPTYIIGENAEYLSEVFKDVRFDLIFSHATYMHFVDPIGSVIEAYKALKPGGKLIIDQFSIPGCEEYTNSLLEYLEKAGYRVLGDGQNKVITNFIIQKTDDKPDLTFPVEFSHIGKEPGLKLEGLKPSRAYYNPTAELRNWRVESNLDEDLYQEARKLIKKETETDEFRDILSKCSDLSTLLNNTAYQALHKNNQKQYLLILRMVAKEYKHFKQLKGQYIMGKEYDEDNEIKDFVTAYGRAISSNTIQDRTTLFDLPGDSFFQANSAIQQLRLVELLAGIDLINRAKTERTKKTLEKMQIPYNEEQKASTYTDPLDYSKIAERHRQSYQPF